MLMKLKDKKVLITGASGFLGTYLANTCFDEGGVLYGIDIKRPLSNNIWAGFSDTGVQSEATGLLFKDTTFDIIFHLAGSASVGLSVQDPIWDFDSLLPPTLKFLTWIKKYCPLAHFVLFSSAAVYGNPESLPIKETAQLHPISPYAIHKLLTETMVSHYSRYYGFKASVLRIFSAFGEGLQKQLFWDVMNRYKAGLTKSTVGPINVSLFGTGNESRDFIHAKDVAAAAVLIAASEETENNFNVYNVATGEEIKIKEAINCLFSKASPYPEIQFGGLNRIGDPERWRADISKLAGIGFESKVSVCESLSAVYTWCMEQ